jgi:hypothetical protein
LDMNPFTALFHGLKSPSCQALWADPVRFIKCVRSVLKTLSCLASLGWGLGGGSIPWDLTSSLAFLASHFDVWNCFSILYVHQLFGRKDKVFSFSLLKSVFF